MSEAGRPVRDGPFGPWRPRPRRGPIPPMTVDDRRDLLRPARARRLGRHPRARRAAPGRRVIDAGATPVADVRERARARTRCGWPSSSPCWRPSAACTSPRSPTSSRACCAGTSASRCTRSSSSSGLAAWRRDGGAWIYAAALAAIGAVISAYHVLLEWFPSLSSGACDPDNPCTLVWFRVFGVFSLPTLALTAFLLILTLVTIRRPADDPRRPASPAARRPAPGRRPSSAAAGCCRPSSRASSCWPPWRRVAARERRRAAGRPIGRRTCPSASVPAAAAPVITGDVAARRSRSPTDDPAVGMTIPTVTAPGRRRSPSTARPRSCCSSPTGARTARPRCRSSRTGSTPATCRPTSSSSRSRPSIDPNRPELPARRVARARGLDRPGHRRTRAARSPTPTGCRPSRTGSSSTPTARSPGG